MDGAEAVRLDAGHLALVPRESGIGVDRAQHAPARARDELPQTMLGDSFSVLTIAIPTTTLLALPADDRLRPPAAPRLLSVLPPVSGWTHGLGIR